LMLLVFTGVYPAFWGQFGSAHAAGVPAQLRLLAWERTTPFLESFIHGRVDTQVSPTDLFVALFASDVFVSRQSPSSTGEFFFTSIQLLDGPNKLRLEVQDQGGNVLTHRELEVL